MKIKYITIICGYLMLNISTPAISKNTVEWWGVSNGQVNIFRDNQYKNNLYGIEARFSPITRWSLVPSVGYHWSDSGISYLYTDLRYSIKFSPKWLFHIHSGLGLFDDGTFLDLGHTVQFRSGFEIDYVLSRKNMVGIVFNHFSNSRLSEINPGTESAGLIFLKRF